MKKICDDKITEIIFPVYFATKEEHENHIYFVNYEKYKKQLDFINDEIIIPQLGVMKPAIFKNRMFLKLLKQETFPNVIVQDLSLIENRAIPFSSQIFLLIGKSISYSDLLSFAKKQENCCENIHIYQVIPNMEYLDEDFLYVDTCCLENLYQKFESLSEKPRSIIMRNTKDTKNFQIEIVSSNKTNKQWAKSILKIVCKTIFKTNNIIPNNLERYAFDEIEEWEEFNKTNPNYEYKLLYINTDN